MSREMTKDHDYRTTHTLAIETSAALGGVCLGVGGVVIATRTFSGPRRHATELVPKIHDLCATHGVAPRNIQEVYVSAGPGSFTGLRIGISVARMIALVNGARLVAIPTLEVIAQNALDDRTAGADAALGSQRPPSEDPDATGKATKEPTPPTADASPSAAVAPSPPNARPDPATPPQRVVVILDAKRSNVYAGVFELADWPSRLAVLYKPITTPAEIAPARLFASVQRPCAVLGEGVRQHAATVHESELDILPYSTFAPRAETVFRLGFEKARLGEFTPARDLVPDYIRLPEAVEKWNRKSPTGG